MKKLLLLTALLLGFAGNAGAQCTSAAPCSMFAGQTPSTSGTGAAIELGVRFFSDSAGTITAIKFYKPTNDTATSHIVNLWSSAGVKLGFAATTSETASGWQTATFTTPIAITATTQYIASYGSTKGTFAFSRPVFTAQYDKAPLHAPVDSTSAPNGPFSNTGVGAFPTTSFSASNYFVDVLFVNGAASGHSVSLTWTQGTTDWTACLAGGLDVVTSNNIYRSTTSGAETFLQSIPAATTFTDSGVQNATTYFYKVTSVNCNGESVKSAEVSATIPSGSQLPSAPPNLQGTSQ